MLILFFVPKHPTAYVFFIWFDAAMAVYLHFGFEVMPRGFSRHWFGRWIMTPTAHQGHHRNVHCNRGLYFLAWDRWMGTADKEYDSKFDVATGAILPTAPASPRPV